MAAARRRRRAEPAGVLLLDKPIGLTSFDAARRAGRAVSIRRVGHAGTLDPAARGLLPLFFGPATRLIEYLSAGHKEYEADVLLGVRTDTLDADGRVVARKPVDPDMSRDRVEQTCQGFVGKIEQTVPVYSAVRVGGRRLHDLARKGQAPDIGDLPRRTVEIFSIEVLSFDSPRFRIRVRCGKGTYIRALAADIGDALGTVASLTGLVRTAVGPLRIEDAVGLDELERASDPRSLLVSPLDALTHMGRLALPGELFSRLVQGQVLRPDGQTTLWENILPDVPILVLDHDGNRVVVAEVDGEGGLHPRKVVVLRPMDPDATF